MALPKVAVFLLWVLAVAENAPQLRGSQQSDKINALDMIRRAWDMKGYLGFQVSGLDKVQQPTPTTSLLNKYTIRHLYSNWGVLFYPQDSPRAPKTKCSFPCDGNTDLRWAETGSPCGLLNKSLESGPCNISMTPQEYSNHYLSDFDGRRYFGSPPVGTCSTPDLNTMLEFQKEMMIQYKDRAPDSAFYSRYLGYNEVVPSEWNFTFNVIGFFFSHPGGFRENLTTSERAWLKHDCENNGPVPQEWLDAWESGSLPFFELAGFTAPFWSKSPDSLAITESDRGPSQARLTEFDDILEGKMLPPAGDEVIRMAPESMAHAIRAIARNYAEAQPKGP